MFIQDFEKNWMSSFANGIDKKQYRNTLFRQGIISGTYFHGNFCPKEAIL